MACAPRSPRSSARQPRAVTRRPGAARCPRRRSSWRSSSLLSRWRARIRSPRTSSRARTRSRSASSSLVGTLTGCSAVDHQQPHHPLGVAPVGLDLVLRRALDLPRRRDHAPNPGRVQRPREPVTRSARPHTPPASGPADAAQNSTTSSVSPDSRARAHLARLAHRSSPPAPARVHVQTSPAANLRHGRPPSVWGCGRPSRAATLGASHSPHASGGSVGLASTAGRPFLHMV